MRLALGLVVLVLCGCGIRVPPIPESAKKQQPRGAPERAWHGQGRLSVDVPGAHLNLDVHVRAPGDGSVRYALLNDAGLLLADVTVTATGTTVHQAVPDLKKDERIGLLSRLFRQAYARYSLKPAHWRSDRLVVDRGAIQRWYGGDPIYLTRVEGGGWPIVIEDYRPLGAEYLAHKVTAKGPWDARVQFRLLTVTADAK